MTETSACRVPFATPFLGALVALSLAALIVGPAAAQEKKPAKPDAPAATAATPKPPAADDKVILPFLSADTVIVGRFDVSRLDMNAVEAYANKMLEEMAK